MSNISLTRDQVRDIDGRAVEQYGMLGAVLMENAGRGCAEVMCELGIDGPVVLCCGKGNNGGDGFVIARHLDLRGFEVRVLLCGDPQRMPPDAARNYETLKRSGIRIVLCPQEYDGGQLDAELNGAAWIVDGLLGTGIRGEPRPPMDRVIAHLNKHKAQKLAIDLPSGLDCDTGQPASNTFRADHTCTFVALKRGFQSATAKPYLGTVHVIDIGVPRKLLGEMNAVE